MALDGSSPNAVIPASTVPSAFAVMWISAENVSSEPDRPQVPTMLPCAAFFGAVTSTSMASTMADPIPLESACPISSNRVISPSPVEALMSLNG